MNEATAMGSFGRNAQLLGLWLSGDHDSLAETLASNPQEATHFLEFIDQQGLGFQFTASLEGSVLRSHIAPGKLKAWERALKKQRVRQANLITELPELHDRMESRDLDYRLLKGPFLAERFFGGVDNRRFGDLDILIHPECLSQANELLTAAGFQRRTSAPLSDRLATRFAHGFDYQRNSCRIDLHWAPATHPSYRIDTAELWGNPRPLPIADRNIPVLSDESALLFLVVSFFEDLDRGAGKLKSAIDIEHMVSAMEGRTDWPALFRRAETEGFGKIFPAILRLATDLTSAPGKLPSLASELHRRTTQALGDGKPHADLLTAPRGSLRNKLWAWRLYDSPWLVAMAWWMLSLPARRAIYVPGRLFGNPSQENSPEPGASDRK